MHLCSGSVDARGRVCGESNLNANSTSNGICRDIDDRQTVMEVELNTVTDCG